MTLFKYFEHFRSDNVWARSIGHGNRDHESSSARGRLDQFTTKLSNPDLDRLLNKALQAPSIGWGCVIPITVPYWKQTPYLRPLMLLIRANTSQLFCYDSLNLDPRRSEIQRFRWLLYLLLSRKFPMASSLTLLEMLRPALGHKVNVFEMLPYLMQISNFIAKDPFE